MEENKVLLQPVHSSELGCSKQPANIETQQSQAELLNKKLIEESYVDEVKIMETELRNEFPQTYKNKDEEERKQWEEKMGKDMKYVKMLEKTSYSFSKLGLKCDINGYGTKTLLSNVLIVPIKIININNGESKKSYIELKGILNTGEKLPTIRIPIKNIDSNNFYTNSEWGIKIFFKKSQYKEQQKKCIKVLGQDIPKETIYSFTGFDIINGKRIFLHSGGAIGTDDDIKVELGDEVLNRFRFTDKKFNIKDTLKVTLACLETAPSKISLPILSLNFLAPLISIFEEVGIPIGFLTWVLGQPQCKKTSLVSAINSHFGNFARNQAPLSFLDGVPSIIYKCAKLRDCVALCDDYFPSTNMQEVAQMKKAANTLISLNFDRIAGSRSKSNGEIRKNDRQSSMIIATGELFPELGQSRTSRVLFINIEKNDVNNKELTYIQDHQEELQYTMKKYIQAIISNIENVKDKIKTIFHEKRKEANKQITMRTAEMISSLYVGYKMLIDFALENRAVNQNEIKELLEEGWKVLMEVGKEQNETVENVSPINMVISAIEVLASTKKLFVVDRESAPYIKLKDIYKSEFIGFYDKERESAFVYPDLLYKKVRDFYRQQGVNFPFNKSTVCKELMRNGFLYKTEKQERPQVRIKNPITQKEETTVGLLTNKIYIPCIYNESGTIKER